MRAIRRLHMRDEREGHIEFGNLLAEDGMACSMWGDHFSKIGWSTRFSLEAPGEDTIDMST